MVKNTRIEKDALGEVEVDKDALYGVHSIRAQNNFYITNDPFHPKMIKSLGAVKKAAALANKELDNIDAKVADAIIEASDELMNGEHLEEFITDAIQGGAGTSLNMNTNEVIANRASQILGGELGTYDTVHPNDDVNTSQSTNDVIPTAGKLTTYRLGHVLLEEMGLLKDSFAKKADEFEKIIKVGRTHLQDAVLISMGQVFESYVEVIGREMGRLEHALEEMKVVNLGATAVGTGINAPEGYRESNIKHFSEVTGIDFESPASLVDGTKHIDGFAYVHSSLKTFALSLSRLANDLRLMASGPKAGLNEIELPERQAGSSIMPGKVNPVIAEVVNQVAFQVIGNDTTVSMAVEAGQMELNVFEPVLFYNLFESLEILTNVCNTLRLNAIDGLTVNEEQCQDYVENSLATATALVSELGYTKVSEIANKALKEDRTLRELVLEEDLIEESKLDKILDPKTMI